MRTGELFQEKDRGENIFNNIIQGKAYTTLEDQGAMLPQSIQLHLQKSWTGVLRQVRCEDTCWMSRRRSAVSRRLPPSPIVISPLWQTDGKRSKKSEKWRKSGIVRSCLRWLRSWGSGKSVAERGAADKKQRTAVCTILIFGTGTHIVEKRESRRMNMKQQLAFLQLIPKSN